LRGKEKKTSAPTITGTGSRVDTQKGTSKELRDGGDDGYGGKVNKPLSS